MTVGASRGRPLIFVTVGTDHFPFSRLMRWLDRWLMAGARGRADVIIQHGASTPPAVTEAHAFLPYDAMQAMMSQATAVVCHGAGPSVLEALEHGIIPIVVPRRGGLGEAVDDHQVLFTERMEAEGLARCADSGDRLGSMLDRAIAQPASFRVERDVIDGAAAVEGFARAVSPLLPVVPTFGAGQPRVLYIAGVGRSGSTLLERILGEVDGFCSVGELVHLWGRGLAGNERCGCGAPFLGCPFWAEVGREAFGGWDGVDAAEVTDLKASVDRHRYIPFMLRPELLPAYEARLERLSDIVLSLYRAIARVSGGVVVDSSKSSSYLFLLRRLRGIDLRVLHLVRDSRGVAYSTMKRVRRPEVEGREAFMPTYPPARAAADWLVYNALFEVAGVSGTPSMHLRYERFVRDPRRQVGRVLRFAGAGDTAALLDFIGPEGARLGPIHSVSGNPMRFRSGNVRVRLDDEWRTRLDARSRATVSAITWPLLRRYGYAVRP